MEQSPPGRLEGAALGHPLPFQRRRRPAEEEQTRREAWGRKWGPILAAISAAAKKGQT